VIEVNPRVSRSSALASKASGYPIARVSAKIAVGMTLDEIQIANTPASFEPTLDYVVTKMARFPFDKFATASNKLSTQMKATGEVMSVGRTIEESLLKAVRSLEIGVCHVHMPKFDKTPDAALLQYVSIGTDDRVFAIAELLRRGADPGVIASATRIDLLFIDRIRAIVEYEKVLREHPGDTEHLRQAKRMGFSDKFVARLWGVGETDVYELRRKLRLFPVYKMIDTCASEFESYIPYFYATYEDENESIVSDKRKILVLGSGPIRIGQGVEFDYSTVHAIKTIKESGYEAIIINNNPETVSTDYTTSDKLYFEPLTPEDVMNVIELEKPEGVIASLGGQTAINLAEPLMKRGVKIIGTDFAAIEKAENRDAFEKVMESLGIPQPVGRAVTNIEDGVRAAETIGYPVLVRPSYVIGGQNMTIAYADKEVRAYMRTILLTGIENPVLVDKYMPGIELEVDVISDGEDVLIPGIMEHIERAGVHSGDSIAVYPPYNLTDGMKKELIDCSERLALALGTKGLVNIQYLIYEGRLYVIEVNPRASRTVPYISKVTGVPMVDLASRVMLGAKLKDLGCGTGLVRTPPYFAVKVPVFSFEKLADVNSYLGPEMKSTGEVLGVGKNMNEALFKGLTAAGIRVPSAGKMGVLLSLDDRDHYGLMALAKKFFDLGAAMYATETTARAIRQLGIDVVEIPGIKQSDDAFKLLESGKIRYIVYTGAVFDQTMDDYIALHRRALSLSIACLTSLDTANALADILKSRYNERNTELVDLNHMRASRSRLRFSKMQCAGTDYIVVDNRDGRVSCAESLCVSLCDRHFGIGGDGIALIEQSDVADARMRMFNRDGSAGGMAGACLMLVGKYLYDKGIAAKEVVTVEAGGNVKRVELFLSDGRVSSARVDMGVPEFSPARVPVNLPGAEIVDRPHVFAGKEYRITCLSLGNPHCVTFVERVDALDLAKLGPAFEGADIFPERVNASFARAVSERMLKLRTYERSNGETLACGTGACAATVAAVKNGLCREGEDIAVKLPGGDLIARYERGRVSLTGETNLAFEGEIEY